MCITFFNKDELVQELSVNNSHKRNIEMLRLLYSKVYSDDDKALVTFTLSQLEMNKYNSTAYNNILHNCVVKLGGSAYNNNGEWNK